MYVKALNFLVHMIGEKCNNSIARKWVIAQRCSHWHII